MRSKKILLILLGLLALFTLGFKATTVNADTFNVGHNFSQNGKKYTILKVINGKELSDFFDLCSTNISYTEGLEHAMYEGKYSSEYPQGAKYSKLYFSFNQLENVLETNVKIHRYGDVVYYIFDFGILYHDDVTLAINVNGYYRGLKGLENFIHNKEQYKNGTLYISAQTEDEAPQINGKTTFLSSVDTPTTVEFIKSQLTVKDDIDGTIPNSSIYVKQDNFTQNNKKLGDWTIKFGVKDKSNNEATLEITVKVLDLQKPTITLDIKEYNIGVTETLDLNDIKSKIKVTDNYDTILNPFIKTDGYTANKANIGKYKVLFAVKDKSNNEATLEITVNVVDNVKPSLSGNFIFKTSYTNKLDLNNLKADFVVSDNIDKDLTTDDITIKNDGYSANYKVPKDTPYLVTFSLKDKSNNEAVVTVQITVIDDVIPLITTNDLFITVDMYNAMSREQIIQFLKDKKIIPVEVVFLNVDTYSPNFNAGKVERKGAFLMKYKAKDSNEVFNVNVLVDGAEPKIQQNQNQNIKDKTTEIFNNVKDFIIKNKYYAIVITAALISLLTIGIIIGTRRHKVIYKGRRK